MRLRKTPKVKAGVQELKVKKGSVRLPDTKTILERIEEEGNKNTYHLCVCGCPECRIGPFLEVDEGEYRRAKSEGIHSYGDLIKQAEKGERKIVDDIPD